LPIAHRYYSTKGPSGSSTPVHPRIAVVGSGPSGLYLTARLLQRLPQCQIDVFDKAQAPYGLIYYGVLLKHEQFIPSIFMPCLGGPRPYGHEEEHSWL
jgi:hypothetical protein